MVVDTAGGFARPTVSAIAAQLLSKAAMMMLGINLFMAGFPELDAFYRRERARIAARALLT
jgi:hypothetical protein